MDYAILKTGGKQYQVGLGAVLDVEKLDADAGDTVELSEVLMLSLDGTLTIGTPTIEGAKVIGVVEEQHRAKKITVFKFKAKHRLRKKTGHRQYLTRLRVTDIVSA
jgi:large subunit ribosomal protein L21|tara:strand:+ start:505 stop:822 length:318 start_codon:yes stop_codon:yes gene_type:complete